MSEWYRQAPEEVLSNLNTDITGLSSERAKAALEKYGENVLQEEGRKSALMIFLGQFRDILVIILIAAALVSVFTGDAKSTIVIISVLILNAVLGTVQEIKAQKSLDALKSLSSPKAKVLRDGIKTETDSRFIVPGDIVIAEAGDMIVADGRIIENYSLQVNESSLTGESTNVDKQADALDSELPLADRINMVYSGSLVTYGRALIAVTDTAMNTEIGRIATLMNQTKEKKTPLQVSLDRFSVRLAIGIIIICAIVLVLETVRGMKIMDALLFAVALAVAAIPEALGSIVTIVQAIGTQRMAKENAVIKNLSAVESLGCVSVICSDKTGTLTQNKMTVQEIYIGEELLLPEELSLSEQLHRYLIYNTVLTNDSNLIDGKGIGDPTEYALLDMYGKIKGLSQEAIQLSFSDLRTITNRIDEVPFDSDRKLMSTKHLIHGIPTFFTKGAVDVLLERCDSIRLKDNVIRPITDEDKKNILHCNQYFSENGLRVLAFAYKESDEDLCIETENHFTFIGLISEMDPPRVESAEAVRHASEAGIRTVMITGDHKVTATAIAKSIGIFREGDMALTGLELDALSDEELDRSIEKISVYARVSPENKIRIVDGWQRKGCIVSMTGDGVNDAPALKKADIGVAMGITGTEVSKDAASMILSDDNFATIIKAVANGRTIYENIKNAVLFLLSGNLSAIIAVIFATIFALPAPFTAVQLLFVNLITDSLPALAIGMEPEAQGVLKRKPRDPKTGLMDKYFIRSMLLFGALISLFVIIAFMTGLKISSFAACSMAFSTLTLARLFHGFNCRGEKSIFSLGFKQNRSCLLAFLLGVILLALVMLTGGGRSLFQVAVLPLNMLILIPVFALIPTVVIQIIKIIKYK